MDGPMDGKSAVPQFLEGRVDLEANMSVANRELAAAAGDEYEMRRMIFVALGLYLKCPIHRLLPMAVFDRVIISPAKARQCEIYYEHGIPVACVSWACLDARLSEKLAEQKCGLSDLTEVDIKTGDDPWILDVVSPGLSQEQQTAVLQKFKTTRFPRNEIKLLSTAKASSKERRSAFGLVIRRI